MDRRSFIQSVGIATAAAAAPALPLLSTPATAVAAPEPQAAGEHTPQSVPPDQVTNNPGVEYFFLGNGVLSCVIQVCTNPASGTPIGVLLSQPNHFARKNSTFLFHPERGLDQTMLTVITENTPHRPTHDVVSAKYVIAADGMPSVVVTWKIGSTFTIEEEFAVSGRQSALLRRVRVKNNGVENRRIKVQGAFYPNFMLFDEVEPMARDQVIEARGFTTMQMFANQQSDITARWITVALGTFGPNETKEMQFGYVVGDKRQDLFSGDIVKLVDDKRDRWSEATRVEPSVAAYAGLFTAAHTALDAAVSKEGKLDAGIWQYNAEWVGDACAAAEGAIHAGKFDMAHAILVRVLKTLVRDDGSPAEASRFVSDDMVELNQCGQLLQTMWLYNAWTGDDLLRSYWENVQKIVDFLMRPAVLDKSGLLHNKREFWERTEMLGVRDGFELAHQACVVAGIESVLEYARRKEMKDDVAKWEPFVKKMRDTMLSDPKFALVAERRFVKRKSMTGEVVTTIVPADKNALTKGSPLASEDQNLIDPDSTLVFPIIYDLVPATGDLAKNTLAYVEKLWNERWQSGGYARYDVSSEPDSAGAWPFASLFIARANALAGNGPKVQQVLDWLVSAQGGQGGGWFENYGDRAVPPLPPVGFVPYAWGEMLTMFVRDMLGFRPDGKQMTVRPRLVAGITGYTARVRYLEGYIDVKVKQGAPAASLNGSPLTVQDGAVTLPAKLDEKSTLEISVM